MIPQLSWHEIKRAMRCYKALIISEIGKKKNNKAQAKTSSVEPQYYHSIPLWRMMTKWQLGEHGIDSCHWQGGHSSMQCLHWNNALWCNAFDSFSDTLLLAGAGSTNAATRQTGSCGLGGNAFKRYKPCFIYKVFSYSQFLLHLVKKKTPNKQLPIQPSPSPFSHRNEEEKLTSLYKS